MHARPIHLVFCSNQGFCSAWRKVVSIISTRFSRMGKFIMNLLLQIMRTTPCLHSLFPRHPPPQATSPYSPSPPPHISMLQNRQYRVKLAISGPLALWTHIKVTETSNQICLTGITWWIWCSHSTKAPLCLLQAETIQNSPRPARVEVNGQKGPSQKKSTQTCAAQWPMQIAAPPPPPSHTCPPLPSFKPRPGSSPTGSSEV